MTDELDGLVKRLTKLRDHIANLDSGSADAATLSDAIEALRSAPDVGDGIAAIATERKRQIEAEGWTPEHDDDHFDGEMARAASCYAWVASSDDGIREAFKRTPPPTWPLSWGKEWWKLKDRRTDLVRAGALIAAEIDRLDRRALADQTKEAGDD